MSNHLEHIKSFFNSSNGQNLYIAWYMLKNHKEYKKGEFRDALMDMFYSVIDTKVNENYVLNLESKITVKLHKYTYEGKRVFSFKLILQNAKIIEKKKIPIEFYEGQKRALFNKVMYYLEQKLERV